MESGADVFTGGIAVALGALLALAAIIALALRIIRHRAAVAAEPTPAPTAAAAPQVAPPPASAPPAAPPPAPALQASLDMVLLEAEGLILGAIPPYGKLAFLPGSARFTAQSRIVAATAGGLLGNDGGSTMQSMGSMEIGDFVEDFALAGAIVGPEPDGHGVRLVAGGRGVRLAAVRGDHHKLQAALEAAIAAS